MTAKDSKTPALPTKPPLPYYAGASMAGVLFLAIAVRIWFVSDPLWLDELHTAWTTSGSWAEVFERSIWGNQSPLFFWMEKLVNDGWNLFFNGSNTNWNPIHLRVIPLAAGVAWIWITFRFHLRTSQGLALPTTVGIVQSLNAATLYYSTESRPYSAVVFLAAVATYQLIRLSEQKNSFRFWPTVFLTTSIFYLHYSSIFFLSFFFLVLFFVVKTERRHLAFLSAAAFFVLSIPGLIQLFLISQRRNLWDQFISVDRFVNQVQESTATFVLYPILFLAISWWWISKESHQADASEYDEEVFPDFGKTCLAVLLLVLGPCVSGFFLTRYQIIPIADLRFMICSLSSAFFLPSLFLKHHWSNKKKNLFCAGILIVGFITNPYLFSCIQLRTIPPLRVENWSHAAQFLQSKTENKKIPVLLFSNLIEDRLLDLQTEKETNKEDLKNYLKFPLKAFPELKISRPNLEILPQPSHRFYAPDQDIIKNLILKKRFFIVARLPGPMINEFIKRIEKQIQTESEDPSRKLEVVEKNGRIVTVFELQLK